MVCTLQYRMRQLAGLIEAHDGARPGHRAMLEEVKLKKLERARSKQGAADDSVPGPCPCAFA